MIETIGLLYKYRDGKEIVFPDLQCKAQDILLVLGSSGVGKTTLLHLLSGLLTLQKGKIMISGQSLTGLQGSALDAFRGGHIGIVFQQNHFVESLNVIENITLAQSLAGHKEDITFAKSILDRLSIIDKANKKIRTLSQGEKQRVAIARAIINRPALILADEPTSALDDKNTIEVLNLLKEQAEQANSALIIVTHDMRLKTQIANQVTLS